MKGFKHRIKEIFGWGGAPAPNHNLILARNAILKENARAKSQKIVADPQESERVSPRLSSTIPGGTVRSETTTQATVGGSSGGTGGVFSWVKKKNVAAQAPAE